MDIPTRAFGAVSVVAFGALASCKSGGTATSPAMTTPMVAATTTLSPEASAAPRPSPGLPPAAVVSEPCPTAIPIVVLTENLTKSRGDLCAAFNRSIKQLRNTSALSAGGFEIRVRLSKLVASPDALCKLGVSVSSKSVGLGSANGGAKVAKVANIAGADRLAARECIDAVLEDLMTRKVGPLMQRHVAGLVGPPNAGSGSNPAPPQPTLPLPAP